MREVRERINSVWCYSGFVFILVLWEVADVFLFYITLL